MAKLEDSMANDVLSEEEKTQLENGLRVLAHIIARAYLKEQALIMKEHGRGYPQSNLSPDGTKTMAEPVSGKSPTMTVREAAELLGMGKNATYEAIHTGKIPHIKIGRRIIISRVKFMEMLFG